MVKNQKGFTLVELLVVIAIIGILAGISVPKVASIREKANLNVVKTDLRSIQTALEIYSMDNNKYPDKSSFTDIDFDDPDKFEYIPNTDKTNYLVYYPETFDGNYYYIKGSLNGLQKKTEEPSLK